MTIKMLKLLFFMLIIFSCKEGKEEVKEQRIPSKIVKKKRECKVVVKGIFPENDSFELFYEENAISNFSQENTLKKGFIGSSEPQELFFDLEGIYPEKIRLDLGSNKNQNFIRIDNIFIIYDEEVLEINESNLFNFLTPNDYIKYQDGQFNLIPKEIEGLKSYDPYLYPTPELVKALIEL